MSTNMLPCKGHRLVFPAKQQVEFLPYTLPEVSEGEVLIKTVLSLMSTGTENIVFNRLFDPGTHWDNWVHYPFYPGYSSVGTVLLSRGQRLKPGDRVTVRCGHQSHTVVDEARCCPIPDGLSFEAASWFALAKIAFHGALAADYQLGDSVLIVGAGPIGQMSVRWASAAGVQSIIVVDTAGERLEMAKKGGATASIAMPIGEARDAVLAANGNALPRVLIDSTGNSAVFAAALSLVDKFGKLVLLGDTGQPASQQLSSDLITRGLTIVGAHDGLETPRWNNTSITSFFLSLVASGRFSMDGLNSHFFPPSECMKAYETANRERSKTMGIVFDWRTLS